MRAIPIHFLPILGATVAKIVLGALWYFPPFFLKPWAKMTGITAEQMQAGMSKALMGDIVGSLVTAFVLACVVGWAEATTALQGLVVGALIWLGFVAFATMNTVTYERSFQTILVAQWLPVDFPFSHECHTGSLALSQVQEETVMPEAQPVPFIDQLREQVAAWLNTLDQEMPIEATVTFPVDRAKESTFVRNADVLTEATRKLPGCKIFAYHKRLPDPGAPVAEAESIEYAIYEAWKSVGFFQAQWHSQALIDFQYAVVDLIKGFPDLRWYYGADYSVEARVAQTGQKQCWDSSGTFINCVGTGQDGEIQAGVPWPTPRFIDNENGTVTDNLTGLIWLKNADGFGEVTWARALTHAHNLASGSSGLTDGSVAGDWRLPNIRELYSLIDYGTGNPCLPDGHPFTDVKSAIYWTSTTLAAARPWPG